MRDVEESGELVTLTYAELRRIAHRQLALERGGHTLSTTAVVHEAWLRLAEQRGLGQMERPQFFAIAARMMRRVLIDHARRYRALRRGGPDAVLVGLDVQELDGAAGIAVEERADDLLALDEALERLAALDVRLARVVECRYFAGLSEQETAAALGVSARTVSRDWTTARGWLFQELDGRRR